MLRIVAVALLVATLGACEAPVAPDSPQNSTIALARGGDPPPPPEDTEVIGLFGTSMLLRTLDLALTEETPSVTGPIEFSLNGRYFVGGGGTSGWLRLSASTDDVVTISDPRIAFKEGGGASGSGAIKVSLEQGFLLIDLDSDVAGATFSTTCAAGGAPCAIIDIVGADFLDLDGLLTEINGTLVVVAEVATS